MEDKKPVRRARNPWVGAFMAALFLGFGSYRLYVHYATAEKLESWQLILAFAIVGYGLFLIFDVIAGRRSQ